LDKNTTNFLEVFWNFHIFSTVYYWIAFGLANFCLRLSGIFDFLASIFFFTIIVWGQGCSSILIKKNGRRRCLLSGACSASQWSQVAFQNGVWSLAPPFTRWLEACHPSGYGKALTIIFFLPSLFSLFYLWFICFSISTLTFDILCFYFIKFDPYYFNFYLFCLWFFFWLDFIFWFNP